MSSILVTGGAGFLGSHLRKRLLTQGYFAIDVDKFYPRSKANILHLLNNPRFEIVRQDVPARRRPDINYARNILEWEPQTPLKAGLEHTIAYFRDAL